MEEMTICVPQISLAAEEIAHLCFTRKFLAAPADFEALVSELAPSQLDTSGHVGAREIIQSPLVSWTHATVQRGFLPSCFNDVVLEQAMKTLRHVRGLSVCN